MFPSYCRITGHSRNLPKPNYFPILPPISPADAKRICRITGKAQGGYDKITFIPILDQLIRSTSLMKCTVTGHFSKSLFVKEGLDAICHIKRVDRSKRSKDNEGNTGQVDQYAYYLEAKNVLLILTPEIENTIAQGDVEDLHLVDDEKIKITTKAGHKYIHRLRDVELDELEEDEIQVGAGVSEETLSYYNKRKESRPAPRKKSGTLNLRKNIFEEKERQAEIELKKAKEKIQPDLTKVEEVQKKIQIQQQQVEKSHQNGASSSRVGISVSKIDTTKVANVEANSYGYIITDEMNRSEFIKASDFNEDELRKTRILQRIISGQFNDKKEFVPGKMSQASNFIPGQVLSVEGTEVFIPGVTDQENRFIPGQTMMKDSTKEEIFIPGQTVQMNGESKFVPGQVVEAENGELKFVPGEIIEDEDNINFVPGDVIQTNEGLRFLGLDLTVPSDEHVEFSLQTFDIDNEKGLIVETTKDGMELDGGIRLVKKFSNSETPEDSATIDMDGMSQADGVVAKRLMKNRKLEASSKQSTMEVDEILSDDMMDIDESESTSRRKKLIKSKKLQETKRKKFKETSIAKGIKIETMEDGSKVITRKNETGDGTLKIGKIITQKDGSEKIVLDEKEENSQETKVLLQEILKVDGKARIITQADGSHAVFVDKKSSVANIMQKLMNKQKKQESQMRTVKRPKVVIENDGTETIVIEKNSTLKAEHILKAISDQAELKNSPVQAKIVTNEDGSQSVKIISGSIDAKQVLKEFEHVFETEPATNTMEIISDKNGEEKIVIGADSNISASEIIEQMKKASNDPNQVAKSIKIEIQQDGREAIVIGKSSAMTAEDILMNMAQAQAVSQTDGKNNSSKESPIVVKKQDGSEVIVMNKKKSKKSSKTHATFVKEEDGTQLISLDLEDPEQIEKVVAQIKSSSSRPILRNDLQIIKKKDGKVVLKVGKNMQIGDIISKMNAFGIPIEASDSIQVSKTKDGRHLLIMDNVEVNADQMVKTLKQKGRKVHKIVTSEGKEAIVFDDEKEAPLDISEVLETVEQEAKKASERIAQAKIEVKEDGRQEIVLDNFEVKAEAVLRRLKKKGKVRAACIIKGQDGKEKIILEEGSHIDAKDVLACLEDDLKKDAGESGKLETMSHASIEVQRDGKQAIVVENDDVDAEKVLQTLKKEGKIKNGKIVYQGDGKEMIIVEEGSHLSAEDIHQCIEETLKADIEKKSSSAAQVVATEDGCQAILLENCDGKKILEELKSIGKAKGAKIIKNEIGQEIIVLEKGVKVEDAQVAQCLQSYEEKVLEENSKTIKVMKEKDGTQAIVINDENLDPERILDLLEKKGINKNKVKVVKGKDGKNKIVLEEKLKVAGSKLIDYLEDLKKEEEEKKAKEAVSATIVNNETGDQVILLKGGNVSKGKKLIQTLALHDPDLASSITVECGEDGSQIIIVKGQEYSASDVLDVIEQYEGVSMETTGSVSYTRQDDGSKIIYVEDEDVEIDDVIKELKKTGKCKSIKISKDKEGKGIIILDKEDIVEAKDVIETIRESAKKYQSPADITLVPTSDGSQGLLIAKGSKVDAEVMAQKLKSEGNIKNVEIIEQKDGTKMIVVKDKEVDVQKVVEKVLPQEKGVKVKACHGALKIEESDDGSKIFELDSEKLNYDDIVQILEEKGVDTKDIELIKGAGVGGTKKLKVKNLEATIEIIKDVISEGLGQESRIVENEDGSSTVVFMEKVRSKKIINDVEEEEETVRVPAVLDGEVLKTSEGEECINLTLEMKEGEGSRRREKGPGKEKREMSSESPAIRITQQKDGSKAIVVDSAQITAEQLMHCLEMDGVPPSILKGSKIVTNLDGTQTICLDGGAPILTGETILNAIVHEKKNVEERRERAKNSNEQRLKKNVKKKRAEKSGEGGAYDGDEELEDDDVEMSEIVKGDAVLLRSSVREKGKSKSDAEMIKRKARMRVEERKAVEEQNRKSLLDIPQSNKEVLKQQMLEMLSEDGSSQRKFLEPMLSSDVIDKVYSKLNEEEGSIESIVKAVLREQSDTRIQDLIKTENGSHELTAMLKEASNLAKILGKGDIAKELNEYLDSAEDAEILLKDEGVMTILRQLMFMREMAQACGCDEIEDIRVTLSTGDDEGRCSDDLLTLIRESNTLIAPTPSCFHDDYEDDYYEYERSKMEEDIEEYSIGSTGFSNKIKVTRKKAQKLEEFDNLLESESITILDNSLAKHKMSVRPPNKRKPGSASSSPTPTKRQGSLRRDRSSSIRRERNQLTRGDSSGSVDITLSELVDTEEEFVRDLKFVVDNYIQDEPGTPRKLSEIKDTLFGNFKLIQEFHSGVLLEGLKCYKDNPKMIGRTFLRLERDFDKHVEYCGREPSAQKFLEENPDVSEYFDDLCIRLDDERTLSEYLRLPLQRINDYQIILEDLIDKCGSDEGTKDALTKALDLMLSIPNKSNDKKFLESIEGFRGNIHKLGKLLKHDWFTVTKQINKQAKDRYVFLFRNHILVTKVKRIAEDRSVFILKDILRLSDHIFHIISEDCFCLTSKVVVGNNFTFTGLNASHWTGVINKSYESINLESLPATDDIIELAESVNKSPEPSTEELLDVGGVGEYEGIGEPEAIGKDDEVNKKTSEKERKKSSGEVDETTTEGEVDGGLKLRRKSSVIRVNRDSMSGQGNGQNGSSLTFSKPVKATECEPGDEASFDCEVKPTDENEAYTISWLKENRPLDDRLADRVKITSQGNKHSLKLLNCRDADTGLYTARVTNQDGLHFTCSAQLTVHKLTPEERAERAAEKSPSFIVKFKDTELLQDTTVCFMIEARGDPTPSIEIRKDGEKLVQDDRVQVHKLNEEHGSYELSIASIIVEDAGLYECIAKNKFGKESFEATVTVVDEKDVFGELEGKRFLEPGEEPEFKWFRDGREIDPIEKFRVLFKDDEDSLALVFQHVKPEDAGLYTCVASTSSGKISCSAELTVQGAIHQLLREPEAPVILAELTDTEVSVGGSAMMELKVKGYPKPQIKWVKEGTELEAGGRFRFLYEDEESIALIIKGVSQDDAGLYKVTATNDLGEAKTEGNLFVRAPPKFKKKMVDMACMTDQTFEMMVEVEGSPTPQLKWYKDGQLILESERIKFKQLDSEKFSITIERVTMEDAGNYSVVASNTIGQMSEFWNLLTQMPAKITKPLPKEVVGESVELTAGFQGHPTPSVKWFHGEKEITKNITTTSNESTLKLTGVTRETVGCYKCVVENQFAKDSTSSNVEVKRSPKFVGALKDCVVKEGDGATFNVKVDAYPRVKKLNWFIDGMEIGGAINQNNVDTGEFSIQVKDVGSLMKGTIGKISASAANEEGEGTTEATISLKCKPKIEENLRDIRVVEDDKNVSLKVKIKGNPEPELKWYHNGVEVSADARVKISKEATETYHLTFNVIIPSDQGEWEVKASNELGETSSKCVVIVEGKPKLEKCLKETIEVVETENLEAEVIVSGIPTPELKWMLGSEHLVSKKTTERTVQIETKIIETPDRKEVIQSTLKLTNITLEDSTDLKVVADNKHGEVETQCKLNIVPLASLKIPKIVTKLEDLTVAKGERAEFKVDVKGNPQPVLKWMLNDCEIKSSSGDYGVLSIPRCKESGKIKVIASNEFGEDSAEAKLTVLFKPEISDLKDVTGGPGDDVSLIANVDGCPEPKVKWVFKGKEIDSSSMKGTKYQLDIKILEEDDGASVAGEYTLKASNTQGESEDKARVLVAQNPPSFIRGLDRSYDVPEGEDLVLKAKVDGSPKPKVQWLKNGEPLDMNDKRISTQMLPDGTCILTIKNATPEDKGQYALHIMNPKGEQKSLCDVNVRATPKVPSFIEDLKVEPESPKGGAPLKLKAKIKGYPPPTVKWLKDNKPIRAQMGIVMTQSPDGTVALEIDNAQVKDSGNYALVLSNAVGDAQQSIQVDVPPPPSKPVIRSPLKPQKVLEGYPCTFEVECQGYPAPNLEWSKDSSPSSQNAERDELEDGIVVGKLVLPKVSLDDAGKYSVSAKNTEGSVDSSAGLEVVSKTKPGEKAEPGFLEPLLSDIYVDEGKPLVLSCKVQGNPIPDAKFFKDGKPIDITKGQISFDGEKLTFTVPCASMSDAGSYECKLSNELGEASATSNVQVKKVYQPPKFTEKFSDTEQMPGYDVKLGGKITGIPFPEINWYKDGKPIDTKKSDKYRVKIDNDILTFTVRDCSDGDVGIYKCQLKNCEGEDTCQAKLDVKERTLPKEKWEAPYFLKAIGETEVFEGMSAKFTACVGGHPEPEYEWFRDGMKLFPTDRIRMEREGVGLYRLMIFGVTEGDVGEYSLRVFNPHGEKKCSAPLIIESLEAREKRKPVGQDYLGYDRFHDSGVAVPLADKPYIIRMSERDITLGWPPCLPTWSRVPVTYRVEMSPYSDYGDDWKTVMHGIRGLSCDLKNILEDGKDYKFRIRVQNEAGMSEPSPYCATMRNKLDLEPWMYKRPLVPSIPRSYDLSRPPHDGYFHAPRFLNIDPDPQYGIMGHGASMHWFVYGYPKPTIKFYFNGSELGNQLPYTYLDNGQITLFVTKMTDTAVGTYECVATNEHGEARHSVELRIADYPYFLRRPETCITHTHKNGRFHAVVRGIPAPEIRWYKDWNLIGESSRIKIITAQKDDDPYEITTILTIDGVIMKDNGLYSVVAKNVAGNVHHSMSLIVEENESDYLWRSNGPNPLREVRWRPPHKQLNDYYDLGDRLGGGTQSRVYHCVERSSGRSFACKWMDAGADEPINQQRRRQWIQHEFDILNGLNHPNIIRLYDGLAYENSYQLITDLCDGGTLLESLCRRTYSEENIRDYMWQLLLSLEYLHDKGIAHLGINLGDLLLERQGAGLKLRLADFSLARRITHKLDTLAYGHPEYVAPEIARGEGVGFAADMWSVGIVTYILLSGYSPFLGIHDMQTLTSIKNSSSWQFERFSYISDEGNDFLRRLLLFSWKDRMNIHDALNHPWMKKIWTQSTDLDICSKLNDYLSKYNLWMDNAMCKRVFRRNPLETAFTDPSKMVYPPDWDYDRVSYRDPVRPTHEPYELPPRPDLNYEIGMIKSESHYQSGPDTYLLQLRDPDFPARLRQYMKVASFRSPSFAYNMKDHHYDFHLPVIRERRRFTDIMDEEIDDERRNRINQYNERMLSSEPRRLKHEIGSKLDTLAEAEAYKSLKRDGSEPCFREKPNFILYANTGEEFILSVLVDGDPEPIVQFLKNDLVITETNRLKFSVENGRHTMRMNVLMNFDFGLYKVVARNKNGQKAYKFRLVEERAQNEDVSLMNLNEYRDMEHREEVEVLSHPINQSALLDIPSGRFNVQEDSVNKYLLLSKDLCAKNIVHSKIAYVVGMLNNVAVCHGGFSGYSNILTYLTSREYYDEQMICLLLLQILEGLSYLHWKKLALLNMEPSSILVSSDGKVKLVDFRWSQTVQRIGSPFLNAPNDRDVPYCAPEQLDEENVYTQTDTWRLGVLIYILLSGVSPFFEKDANLTRQNIQYVRFRFQPLHANITQEANSMILLIFKKAPFKRPTVEEILDSRWLNPTEFMNKKRLKAKFSPDKLKEFEESYMKPA